MICTFDPRLILWPMPEMDDQGHRLKLMENCFLHIDWLKETENAILIFTDKITNIFPYQRQSLYPEMTLFINVFLNFITNFKKILEPEDDKSTTISLEPDLCAQFSDNEQLLLKGFFKTMLNHEEDMKCLLTYEKLGFINEKHLHIFYGELTKQVEVLQDREDWLRIFLLNGPSATPDDIKKKIEAKYKLEYSNHERYVPHQNEYVITEEFIESLDNLHHKAAFSNVINSLTIKIYNLKSSSINDEKEYGRLYVIGRRGDRIKYEEKNGVIYFRYYIPPGKHDDYKISGS